MSYDSSSKSTGRIDSPDYKARKDLHKYSYSQDPTFKREEQKFIMDTIFKGRSPVEFQYCVACSSVIAHGRDYLNQVHNTERCKVISIDAKTLLDKYPRLGEMLDVVTKLQTQLSEVQRQANLTEEEKDEELRRHRHKRGHVQETTRTIQIQEQHDECDRIE